MTETVDRPGASRPEEHPGQSPGRTRTEAWLSAFAQALAAPDPAAVASLFVPDCYWRDLVAFTWNIVTVEGRESVADLVGATAERVAASGFAVLGEPTEAAAPDGTPTTEAWWRFETAVGRGTGHVRLVDGKAWTVLTTLDELIGHEEARGGERPKGVAHGADPDRVTYGQAREREAAELGRTRQPEVVVIGGGQGGIALGARLRQLGIPHVVLERNERAGDSWRRRYRSLALHDPVWYDHLPYIPFPDTWPVFSPKDKIGDWLEMYTRVMEINYWASTTARSAVYDAAEGRWSVLVERRTDGGEGQQETEELTLRPSQLVFALGVSGKPNVPTVPGQDRFRGEQQHSSEHPGPDGYADSRVVVIGSNNSAHDICAALWEVGADVTMVQRSSTHVVRSDSLLEHALAPLYSERAVADGIDTRTADLTFASMPYGVLAEFQKPAFDAIREQDAEFYRRLAAAGFEVDFGADDSGLFMKYLRRGSGYYIDVGASELVADGSVALARGDVAELTEDGVVLTDGTRLPADLVVYATGYRSMNGLAADIVGEEMADRVGKVWGLGSGTAKDPGPWEGEERNMWKPTAQEGLWFHGGNLHQSRHYSLYLALQLKARVAGIPTPVYGRAPVHHRE